MKAGIWFREEKVRTGAGRASHSSLMDTLPLSCFTSNVEPKNFVLNSKSQRKKFRIMSLTDMSCLKEKQMNEVPNGHENRNIC